MPTALDQFRLDARVATVAPASRDLGTAMALALAEAGVDAHVAARAARPRNPVPESESAFP
jgi:NAD(P)-dependent dehydrogenase (short-subunit alcohol dehydrogenase family)